MNRERGVRNAVVSFVIVASAYAIYAAVGRMNVVPLDIVMLGVGVILGTLFMEMREVSSW